MTHDWMLRWGKRVFTACAVLFAVFFVLILASCGGVDDGSVTSGESTHGINVTMKDGRVIPCVVFYGSGAGGISCDWANAH